MSVGRRSGSEKRGIRVVSRTGCGDREGGVLETLSD